MSLPPKSRRPSRTRKLRSPRPLRREWPLNPPGRPPRTRARPLLCPWASSSGKRYWNWEWAAVINENIKYLFCNQNKYSLLLADNAGFDFSYITLSSLYQGIERFLGNSLPLQADFVASKNIKGWWKHLQKCTEFNSLGNLNFVRGAPFCLVRTSWVWDHAEIKYFLQKFPPENCSRKLNLVLRIYKKTASACLSIDSFTCKRLMWLYWVFLDENNILYFLWWKTLVTQSAWN